MLIDYKALSENSRVFIYPGSRKFYEQEIDSLTTKLTQFCESMEGVEMAFVIKYQRFIVFVVSDQTPLNLDQQNSMVELIQEIEAEYEMSLLDKVNVCFKQGQYAQVKEIPEFKKLIRNKAVSKNTIIFDNMLHTKSEFETIWESEAKNSWIAHFFKN